MTKQEIISLVRQGEHHTLEFKKKAAHPEKIVREIVAFANSKGGTLLVGVADNGELSGIPYPEEEIWVLDKAIQQYCRPKINYSIESIPLDTHRWVISYQIEEGKQKPYYVLEKEEEKTPYKKEAKPRLRKKTYVRKNDRSIQASRELREILRRERKLANVGISWGPAERKLMQQLDARGSITVKEFATSAEIKRSVAAGILIRMVLAGVLSINPAEQEDRFTTKPNN